jgi:hypothetical protein
MGRAIIHENGVFIAYTHLLLINVNYHTRVLGKLNIKYTNNCLMPEGTGIKNGLRPYG